MFIVRPADCTLGQLCNSIPSKDALVALAVAVASCPVKSLANARWVRLAMSESTDGYTYDERQACYRAS